MKSSLALKKMATLAQTKCACGETLEVNAKPPKRFKISTAKVQCHCGSKYIFSVQKTKMKTFNLNAQVLELSEKAKQLIKNNLRGENEKTEIGIR